MAIDISATTRRIVYTGSAGLGPYAYAFNILVNTDLAVYFNDTELTLTTDYTVVISADGTGSITVVTGTNVPTTPDADDRITIIGNRTIERTTDFTTGGPLFATSLNDEFDSLTIFTQQNLEQSNRSLRAPNTDPTTINMELPNNVTRANKTLAFDADGNPTIGELIGDWKGDWAASVAYNKRDLIKDTSNDNVYICVVAHTSSGSQPISSNTDVAKWDLVVDAAAAGAARIAAEAAQAAAELAETNAETAETNAETAETNAASSASAASTSATNAATSASNASTSATTASTAATNAGTSETNAASSASSASTSASTATTKASEASTSATNAATSASSASTSATTATTQASNASTSATNAATSASTATTQASNASTSATNAATSETNAATSETNAAASYDAFDDRYLGAKASAPTLDNDGNALLTGALYWNTTDDQLYVWTGSVWDAAAFSVAGTVTAFNTRTGAVTLTSGDVTTALTYTPFNAASAGALATLNTVATAQIDNDAVTEDKLANTINDAIAANTAKVTNATHTGDVTGATALTIANDAVTTAKILDANVTDAKIATMSSSKLTGALPAIDGSALTGLGGGGSLQRQLFTSPGTWTSPGTATNLRVTVLGGGGGGFWNSAGGPGTTSSFGSYATATGGTSPPNSSSAGVDGTGTLPAGIVIANSAKRSYYGSNIESITGTERNLTTTATAYSATAAGTIAGAGANPSPGGPSGLAGHGGLIIGLVPGVSSPVAVTVGVGGPKPPPNGQYAGKNGAVLVEWVG